MIASTTPTTRPDASALGHSLTRVRWRLRQVSTIAGIGWAVIAAIAAVAIAAWLDLLWELDPATRVAAWVTAAAAIVATAIYWAIYAHRNGRDASLADSMDRAVDSGGEFRSGLELGSGRMRFDGVLSRGLATMAVERASQRASAVSPSSVVSQSPAIKSWRFAAISVAALAAIVVAMPEMVRVEWLRLTDPWGDHPPFSRVTFTVEPGDTRVVYGTGVEIHATAAGAPVDRVELVIRSMNGGNDDIVPMFPEADGKWRTALHELTAEAEYFVRGGSARSQRHRISIITVPRIDKVRYRLTPPAYTNLSPLEGPVPNDGLAGLPGTRVQLRVTSNRPLGGGTLKLPGADAPVALVAIEDASHDAMATFEIHTSGKFELAVTDVDGQISNDRFMGAIQLLPDQRPFIRIIEPPVTSIVTAGATVPVLMSAEDDYGISAVQLFRSLNDSRPLPMNASLPAIPPKRLDVSVDLAMSAYGLEPGDVIKLFSRVEDNDPSGAKGAESSIATLHVVSQEEFDRMLRTRYNLEMLTSKYQQAERRLASLKEQQEGLRKKMKDRGEHPLENDDRKELKKLADQLARDVEEMRKIAAEMTPYDIDHNLTKRLQKLTDEMNNASKGVRRLSKNRKMSASELSDALAKLMKPLDLEGVEFEEQALEPIAHLERVFPLIADQATFVELYQRQRDLAQRASALAGHDQDDNPAIKARMRDLQIEQHDIQIELESLLEEIESHLAVLPEEESLEELRSSAREFVEAVRSSEITATMSEAETALMEFIGTTAADRTKHAADLMEKFLSRCNGMGKLGRTALVFKPSLSNCLGDTVAQLLADMGLGGGDNPGEGMGRGGYSTQRHSLQNVGLYGTTSAASALGGRGDRKHTSASARASSAGAATVSGAGAAAGEAGSASIEQIPAQYRRRVSDYFQQILEELEQP